MARRLVPFTAAVALCLTALSSPAAASAPVPDAILEANLTGAAEVGLGDPDGTGQATLYIDGDTSRMCVSLRVENIAQATAAHVHQGVAGTNGPVYITLPTPKTGRSFECKQVTHELLAPLVANPSGYYVNVHNAEFPAGAVRGQLSNPYA